MKNNFLSVFVVTIFIVIFFIISLILSISITRNLDSSFLINTVLIASAFYLFFITLRDFVINKFKNLSQTTAHFGFSLLILSILLNNIFSTEIITNLKIGETFRSEKFNINFEKIEQQKKQNFMSITGKFIINNSNGTNEVLNPELRIYNQPNIVTSEADIKTNIFTDKFMTMNLVQSQEYFNIRYQVKPFMIWIWISVMLISFGGIVTFFKKKYEK